MTLPVVYLDGDPRDQGRQHGLALRDQIGHNLRVYYDRFATEVHLDRDDARVQAASYCPLLESHPYYSALMGMADGSGFDLLDLLVLNLRYELLYYQYSIQPVVSGGADGCTSFAVLPVASDDGHLLLGENWDWIPQVRGAVIFTHDPDGLETLGFTEAGIVGTKLGLNSAGLGLAINGLLSTSDDWSRRVLPFHVRCYEILKQRTLGAAAAVVADEPRGCSANFVLAQVGGTAFDLEAAPDSTQTIEPEPNGTLVHTNHFLHPEQLGIREPVSERRPHTYTRRRRMRALLDARVPVTVGDLEVSLRDHDNYPDSICRHENSDDPAEEWLITVTSAIMDLDERTLRLTDGPPCEHLYEGYSLPHTAVLGR